MAKKSRVVDFTQGDPAKHILAFFGPLLLTSTLQQLYNFVDAFIVGKGLGDHALASVGNMGSLFFLIVGFSFGLANGFSVLIAQSFGAKDIEKLRHRLAGTLQLAVILTVVLTTLSIIFLPRALMLMRTDKLLMGNCLKYGYIIFGGLFAAICYNTSSAVLRALGDSKTPLLAIIVSSVINLFLDWFLIFVIHTGVEGAAIATVASQIISSLVCLYKLKTIKMISLEKRHFTNDRKVYTDLLKNGLPMAFMNSITAIGCMSVQCFINGYGVDYTTAYSACSKYINLFINPASTAGVAMSSFTSQNYGAEEYGRIREGLRVCLLIALSSYVLLGALMTFAPRFLAGILIEGNEAINLAVEYFPICGISMVAVNCLFVFRSGVQGMGQPIIPMWSGVLEMVLRIVVISVLIGRIGFSAAAFAEVSAWLGAFIFNTVAFYRILIPKLHKDRVGGYIGATGFLTR